MVRRSSSQVQPILVLHLVWHCTSLGAHGANHSELGFEAFVPNVQFLCGVTAQRSREMPHSCHI